CADFERSERLDPAAGTLINWAECLSRQGKVASSWLTWREALEALPAGDERRGAAEERARALEPRVPRLEIRLAPGPPRDREVRRDGVVVAPAALGLGVPADPGPHTITVNASGHVAAETSLSLAEGERRVLVAGVGPELIVRTETPRPAPPPARPA